MTLYFVTGLVLATALALAMYYVLQDWVLKEKLKLDDAKGYFLIGCIVIAFAISALYFYLGQQFGFDQEEQRATIMALSILLDIMATLLALIYGLVKFHEPEHYS